MLLYLRAFCQINTRTLKLEKTTFPAPSII